MNNNEKKKDIFRLIDKNGYAIAELRVNIQDHCMDGELYSITSWDSDSKIPYDYNFITDMYIKWDACSHYRFYGEEYNEKKKDKIDPYYHICGSEGYVQFIQSIAFMYKVAEDYMTGYDKEEWALISKINKDLLEECTIEKIEK